MKSPKSFQQRTSRQLDTRAKIRIKIRAKIRPTIH
jgi:hypothetical protein